MKTNKAFILVSTISISVMIILFTVMVIVIGNDSDNFASGPSIATEASFDVREDNLVKNDVGEAEQADAAGSINESEISGDDTKIYLSDDVVLSLDDTAIKEVEYESSYVNTVELLPSLYYERETVAKKKVSTDNFPKSTQGAEIQTVSFSGYIEGEEQSISLPSEITIYNVESEDANSCKVTAEITGDESYIKSIGWSTKDSSKLSLSRTSGKSVTISRNSDITGQMCVSVVITYYTGKNSTATETVEIYVNVLDMDDENVCLYDMDGNQLYLDAEGTEPAHLADYASEDSFYGAIRITGWQTVEGKTYYFDRDGWPVTGNQIIGGMQYSFDSEGVLISNAGEKGIDVSLYQKEIDWEQVAASGVTFAIIRCGFRGAVTARLVEDSCFRKNIEGAKAAGIRVGVYFFTQAVNEAEAAEEAAMVLSLCKDYTLDLPIFIDSENAVNGRANGLDRTTRTNVIKKFCDTINAGGFTAGVYASKCWYYEKLYASELESYEIWVAQYNTVCDYKGKIDYWQYSSKEHINGIEGNVDVDIIY